MTRHVDVGDEDRNLVVLFELIESVLPIGGADHIAAQVFQHVREDCEDSGIVSATRTERGIVGPSFLPTLPDSTPTFSYLFRGWKPSLHPKLLDGQVN